MSDLVWEAVPDGDDGVLLTLGGKITESADFGPLLERAAPRVRVDLSGVTRINSVGLRSWIGFITSLCEGREVVLERCAAAFTRQLSMIANATATARVQSIMLPYFCEECDREYQELVELTSALEIAEELECPECHGTMEFDDLPENYATIGK